MMFFKFLIMFLIRVAVMPFVVLGVSLTALFEYASPEPDWDFWLRFNEPLIDLLPWSKYRK